MLCKNPLNYRSFFPGPFCKSFRWRTRLPIGLECGCDTCRYPLPRVTAKPSHKFPVIDSLSRKPSHSIPSPSFFFRVRFLFFIRPSLLLFNFLSCRLFLFFLRPFLYLYTYKEHGTQQRLICNPVLSVSAFLSVSLRRRVDVMDWSNTFLSLIIFTSFFFLSSPTYASLQEIFLLVVRTSCWLSLR